MPTAKLNGLVNQLGQAAPVGARSVADAELLARFVATRDETAFAELVRRHGRLVFGVCRRVTGNHHLAEDAFQAVFVVLAAKAAAIHPPAAVGAWLHGVAVRTALRARTMANRRRRRETVVSTLPEAHAPEAAKGLDAVDLLDEEIARLTDRLRVPVVLCELEGVSRKEAAQRLGIREGTLSSRLASARKALAERLRQRGVVLSAAGLSAVLAQTATAAPPAALSARALAAATPELIPPTVGALSNGVLRIMLLDKLKTVALITVSLGLAACAALAAAPNRPQADPPPAAKPAPLVLVSTTVPEPAKVEAQPLPRGPNKLLLFRSGQLVMIDPDGKNERKLIENSDLYHPGGAKFSPNGQQLATLVPGPLPPDDGTPGAKRRIATLHVRGLDEKEPGTNLGVECQLFVWSGDGAEILCCDFVDGTDKKTPDSTHFIVNVKTKEKTAVNLPADHRAFDWSRDGKYFLTTRFAGGAENPQARQYLMNRDGTEHKALTDDKELAIFGRFSPDGTRALFGVLPKPEPGRRKPPCRELMVLDIATGKQTKVDGIPLDAEIQGYCWSPDGKRIALTWRQLHDGEPNDVINRETESHLVVCDPDGKNQKTILTEKGQGQWHITLAGVDWR